MCSKTFAWTHIYIHTRARIHNKFSLTHSASHWVEKKLSEHIPTHLRTNILHWVSEKWLYCCVGSVGAQLLSPCLLLISLPSTAFSCIRIECQEFYKTWEHNKSGCKSISKQAVHGLCRMLRVLRLMFVVFCSFPNTKFHEFDCCWWCWWWWWRRQQQRQRRRQQRQRRRLYGIYLIWIRYYIWHYHKIEFWTKRMNVHAQTHRDTNTLTHIPDSIRCCVFAREGLMSTAQSDMILCDMICLRTNFDTCLLLAIISWRENTFEIKSDKHYYGWCNKVKKWTNALRVSVLERRVHMVLVAAVVVCWQW